MASFGHVKEVHQTCICEDVSFQYNAWTILNVNEPAESDVPTC